MIDLARHSELGAQLGEVGLAALLDPPRDVVHRRDERHALARNGPLLGPRLRQHLQERALELFGIDVVALHHVAGRIAGFAKEERPGLGLIRAQLLSQLAILRVGDEPAAQPFFDLFGRLARPRPTNSSRNRRQERARLEEQQRRRDHEILRGHLDVERLHGTNVLEILLRDARQRHGGHVELLLLDQTQQQVERTVEHVEPNVERGRGASTMRSSEPTVATSAGSPSASGCASRTPAPGRRGAFR